MCRQTNFHIVQARSACKSDHRSYPRRVKHGMHFLEPGIFVSATKGYFVCSGKREIQGREWLTFMTVDRLC